MDMIELDGSHGGGQLLRTALTLSLCTGTAFALSGIRAGRSKPGLMRQHLASVNAAAQVGSAQVYGAELGSLALRFEPGTIGAGDHTFAIGSAGSTTLVLQTVLPALARASGPSTLRLEGGTHNPMAPTADFIAKTWLPRLRDIGYEASIELERPGFYPAGGGILHARIEPAPALKECHFTERGEARGLVATALLSGLSSDIGRRELAVLGERFGLEDDALQLRSVRPANGLRRCSPDTAHGASRQRTLLATWRRTWRAIWLPRLASTNTCPTSCCFPWPWREGDRSPRRPPVTTCAAMRP